MGRNRHIECDRNRVACAVGAVGHLCADGHRVGVAGTTFGNSYLLFEGTDAVTGHIVTKTPLQLPVTATCTTPIGPVVTSRQYRPTSTFRSMAGTGTTTPRVRTRSTRSRPTCRPARRGASPGCPGRRALDVRSRARRTRFLPDAEPRRVQRRQEHERQHRRDRRARPSSRPPSARRSRCASAESAPSTAAAAVSTIGRKRRTVASMIASHGVWPAAMSWSIWSTRITELRMMMPGQRDRAEHRDEAERLAEHEQRDAPRRSGRAARSARPSACARSSAAGSSAASARR